MDPHAGKIVLNGAPGQLDRWLQALDPGHAPVDGRSFPEILDFAVRFGQLIRYYGLENEADGDWVEFFLADPTMILAVLATVDGAALEAEYLRKERETRRAGAFNQKFQRLRETFGLILDLARRINLWLEVLDSVPRDSACRALRQRIAEDVRDGLAAQLRRLEEYAEGAGLPSALDEPLGLHFSGFLPVWRLCPVCPDGSIYRGATRSRKIDHALPFLRPVFHGFLDTVEALRFQALAALPATLGGGRHKPQIALYIAFARLFARAQETINTFSRRYVDFYQQQILREPPASAFPDSLYLTFALKAAAGPDAAVPQGTSFPAGKDAGGSTILYAADRGLTVTAARIAALRTLRALPGPDGPRRILSSEVSLAAPAGSSWATFGESAAGTGEAAVTRPALLGFAVAAEELLLLGGERTVTLGFDFVFRGKPSSPEILRGILERRLHLYGSTLGGWFCVENHEVRVAASPAGTSRFTLRFTLPPSAPPLVALAAAGGPPPGAATDPEILAANPAPALPTLKAYWDQEPLASADPLSILQGLAILACHLHVEVRGLGDLKLENTDGEIHPGQPFPVFGGQPVPGSFLQMRSVELFSKVPESLSIVVDWLGLPPGDTGFAGYYRDYAIGPDGGRREDLFDNRTFRGTFRVSEPGLWALSEGSQEVFLFRTRNGCASPMPVADEPLCSTTGFGDLAVLASPDGPPPYYAPAASALRLELAAPSYAFGGELYARNVVASVIQDLPSTSGCRQKCLGLCAPLRTSARGLAALSRRSGPGSSTAEQVSRQAELLLEKAVEGLRRCLQEHRTSRDPQETERLRSDLETLRTLPPARQAECLRACVAEILGVPSPSCRARCPKVSLALADAAAGLFRSLDGSPAGLAAAAREHQALLEDEYAACLESCMDQCLRPEGDLQYPNNPYLPRAASVRVDYTARAERPAFFHLLPFGGSQATSPDGETPLLPPMDEPGTLYLGFSRLVPPQPLTLLFQMTGDRAGAPELPPVSWACLDRNRWSPPRALDLRGDTTGGLRRSGTLTLDLPAFDPSGNTILPGAFQWLRATVSRDPGLFPRTAAVTPHVLTATWQPGSGDGGHLARPLPAGTITSSVQPLPGVGAISQPMESFGGVPRETPSRYDVRLGERLRHKDRAVLSWDDERLVLERFPTVWQARALPARDLTGGGVPGSVLVVIVPGPAGSQGTDPTAPAAPLDLLAHIQTDLQGLASPFVRIQVVNPVYVRIRVIARVQLTPGTGVQRLDHDLVSYLSPWTHDSERAARAGRYACEEEIADFIETRPYVESLVCIDFSYHPDPATLQWYFLTSARDHRLESV
jgi:hypothetical protein